MKVYLQGTGSIFLTGTDGLEFECYFTCILSLVAPKGMDHLKFGEKLFLFF